MCVGVRVRVCVVCCACVCVCIAARIMPNVSGMLALGVCVCFFTVVDTCYDLVVLRMLVDEDAV